MKKSDIEKADRRLMDKILCVELLNSAEFVDGQYELALYPELYGSIVKTITEGDTEYCERHGHMMHSKYDFCVLCNKKGSARQDND